MNKSLKRSDIKFTQSKGQPDYMVYFEYHDAVFAYCASITKPHKPEKWEAERNYDTSIYDGEIWAVPREGGGYNQIFAITCTSYKEVEKKMIDKIMKYYIEE